ncbi:pyruvate dehydrogenase complex dihydrolipoamide acetyltransferase [Sphingomonas sp. CFBP 13720]|uniref:pyruvate dehydrogenase complex dihydrolipoamide acetyltransferase n=1 Tax=Sphingomonas sp. CFBP 13720 TaxID=2775302 RepID=UPI00178471C4|nr:pyruvate dehydrogenase complex dihydrolipoamide acetyltransferase [Sphingomonas sp. CFBP 13720]MBD8677533.1 pyruvate dehydrogenase complex dihydrolipoamide acetyltransferase [Sphingomonas sp. CFBP 13720]
MPIEIKMPALSPTMEEGTLAKWLVKEGDTVKSGDIMAEIETDKATMEFEAVDEGMIGKVLVAEGSDNVKVGAVIAILLEEGEDASAIGAAPAEKPAAEAPKAEAAAPAPAASPAPAAANAAPAPASGDRVKASPLARRIAADKGLDLSALSGSGPNGRIVKADVESAKPGEKPAPKAEAAPAPVAAAPAPAAEAPKAAAPWFDDSIPHTVEKLSNIRKTIARRLTESKQQVPHIYLTVDVRLDSLLKLRADLNKSLDARGIKVSVNDLLIKALGVALEGTPKCNVTFLGNDMVQYSRADVSVAVSTPTGLITPIVRDAANKGVAKISTEMKELAGLAKENKLKPEQYQGGTASLSNMGMFGIKQFEAVINPPQGMILAVGAGEKRPYIVDDALGVATVMTATGSFDHRAIDGADGAQMLKLFKALVESPLGLVA